MTPTKFVTTHKLGEFQLLREFVARSLWTPALLACDEAIASCEEKIMRLQELKTLIEEERG